MLLSMIDTHVLAFLQLLQALVKQQGGSASGAAGPALPFRACTPAAVPPAAQTLVAASITPAAQAAGSPTGHTGDKASSQSTGTAASPLDVDRQRALKRSQDATEALATLVTGLHKKQELVSGHPSAQVTC